MAPVVCEWGKEAEGRVRVLGLSLGLRVRGTLDGYRILRFEDVFHETDELLEWA